MELYGIVVMLRKTIKHAFSMFNILIKHGFDQSKRAQGPIYIIRRDKNTENVCFSFSYLKCVNQVTRN